MIDPRPYTYQYRKPRLNNPTFQSSNLYESLYHLRIPSKNEYFFPRENKNLIQPQMKLPQIQPARQYNNPQRYQLRQSEPRYEKQSARQQTLDNKQRPTFQSYARSNSVQKQFSKRGDSRQIQVPSQVKNNGIQSHLSSYSQNLRNASPFDRFSVYEKQQKGYNIINCYPKQMTSSLRVFPKLTLENKLIQSGRF